MAQFVHNSWPSHTTGFTLFQLLMGFMPKLEVTSKGSSPFPSIKQWRINLEWMRDRAQEAIRKAQRMVILQGEKKRGKKGFKPFHEGDRVWLEGTHLKLSHPTAKLAAQRYGPFQVTKVVSPVVY